MATDRAHLATAMSPSAAQEEQWSRDDWRDPSPHRENATKLGSIRLHYLDWGGAGQAIVLLHGMGHTAHIFDEFAPRFTDRHRVVALTLRGHGASSQPATQYTVDSMATDVAGAIAELGLHHVILIGHSLGGHVANRVAALFPENIDRVVYLDAAKDTTGLAAVRALAPSNRPTPGDSAWDTPAHAQRTYRTLYFNFWSDGQEADFRAQRSDERVMTMADLYALQDWRGIKVPQLDICALDTPAVAFPWLSGAAREQLHDEIQRYVSNRFVPWEQAGCERFAREAPAGTMVVIPESNHYVFLVSAERTVKAVKAWLGE